MRKRFSTIRLNYVIKIKLKSLDIFTAINTPDSFNQFFNSVPRHRMFNQIEWIWDDGEIYHGLNMGLAFILKIL